MTQTVSKSAFKPHALKYFRQIEKSGEELIITDRAKPVLKIVRFEEKPQVVLRELRGSVKYYNDPFAPVGQDDWELLK